MKRLFCVALAILLICLLGCSKENDYISPVEVYYTSKNVDYHSQYGAISTEMQEYNGWEDRTREFLNQYISGPFSENLVSPFPAGAWILAISQEDANINIRVNNKFSTLSPNEYTLACTCLSLTVLNLYHAETVNIQISGEQTIISMNRDNLMFHDQSDAY